MQLKSYAAWLNGVTCQCAYVYCDFDAQSLPIPLSPKLDQAQNGRLWRYWRMEETELQQPAKAAKRQ
jgi:hypothetical protein